MEGYPLLREVIEHWKAATHGGSYFPWGPVLTTQMAQGLGEELERLLDELEGR